MPGASHGLCNAINVHDSLAEQCERNLSLETCMYTHTRAKVCAIRRCKRIGRRPKVKRKMNPDQQLDAGRPYHPQNHGSTMMDRRNMPPPPGWGQPGSEHGWALSTHALDIIQRIRRLRQHALHGPVGTVGCASPSQIIASDGDGNNVPSPLHTHTSGAIARSVEYCPNGRVRDCPSPCSIVNHRSR